MRHGFPASALLRLSVLLCSACSLVLGDIPENFPAPDGSGGGGHAGDGVASGSGGTIDAGADTASGSTGGSVIDGAGAGGSSCAVGGGAGDCGAAGSGGRSGGGAGGSGGASSGGAGGNGGASNGGAGPGDGSPGDAKVDGPRDAGNAGAGSGGAPADGPSTPDAPRDVSVPPDSGTDAPDLCDLDMDGHRSRLGNCGGDDCDDNAFNVHPGQTVYFEDPTQQGGSDFDYDCSGFPDPDPQYKAINCAGLIGLGCDQSGSGFLGMTTPACGQAGPFGHCVKMTLSCVEQVEQQSKKMPCK